jgi:hypothetical protein
MWVVVLITAVSCLFIGAVWGAGRVFRFYEALAQDDRARIADLSKENDELRGHTTRGQLRTWEQNRELTKENAQLRADLTRWQNERLSL